MFFYGFFINQVYGFDLLQNVILKKLKIIYGKIIDKLTAFKHPHRHFNIYNAYFMLYILGQGRNKNNPYK